MPVFACQGGGDEPLKLQLRRITDTVAIEIPPEMLTPIIQASQDADYRRDIMKHLRECLSEPTGKRWRRIYGGMLLVEKLMEKGAHALVIELAHGHHFDLIQKVSLLEHFDAKARGITNPWAQQMVRTKAAELRASLVPQLEQASLEELPQDAGLFIRDSCSHCSLGEMSTSTGSTAASSFATNSSSSGRSPAVQRLGLVSRMQRRGKSSVLQSPEQLAALSPRSRLQSELKRLSECRSVEMPPELFTYVVEVSFDPDSQHVILKFLRGCLGQPARTRWQHVYTGLSLCEHIVQRGCRQMFEEVEQPGVFSLVRQVRLLQEYDYRVDWRAQNLVRKKAGALHDKLSQQLQDTVAQELADEVSSHIDDSFVDLRAWVEAADNGPPSRTSSRPSTDTASSKDPDVDPGGRLHTAGGHRTPGLGNDSDDDTVAELPGGHHQPAAETFFTPMQTPAQVRAIPRPSHLLSL